MMFDQEGLEHILSNLISNAIKYTNEKGEVNVISFLHNPINNIDEEAKKAGYTREDLISKNIDIKNKNPFIVILVSDTGIGIEKENINSIFSKFRQLDTKNTVTKKQKGTGLGLVIARGIVNEHGGEIGVISKIGVGSTFFFTLPLV